MKNKPFSIINRSFFFPIFCTGWVLLPACARAQNDEIAIPEAYPSDRYETIWKKSPFTLSSTNEGTVGSFAENLILAGVVKIGNQTYVSILDKTSLKRELISTEPNKDGLRVLKIQSSNDLEKVTATLKKGEEVATIRYDLDFSKIASSKTAGAVASAASASTSEAASEATGSPSSAVSSSIPTRKRPPIPSRPPSQFPSFIKTQVP